MHSRCTGEIAPDQAKRLFVCIRPEYLEEDPLDQFCAGRVGNLPAFSLWTLLSGLQFARLDLFIHSSQ
jgi:hypothetical protein